jgi:uncharacterized protein YjgD (DUF1641 family)
MDSNITLMIKTHENDNQRLLIIDPVTGIVRDMTLNETISGNYCFSDLQTEWATDFTENILNYGQNIRNILTNGNGIIDLSQLANNTKNGLTGFISSAMMSLESTSIFFVNNIPSNSFSTFLGLNMIGLACFNSIVNREGPESASSHVILDSGNANLFFWHLYPNSYVSRISPNLYNVQIYGPHTVWGWYSDYEPYHTVVPTGAGDDFTVIYNPNGVYWDGSGYVDEGVWRWGPHTETGWYEVIIWYSDEKITNPYLHP